MNIDTRYLLADIIRPGLDYIGQWSLAAGHLILGTLCASQPPQTISGQRQLGPFRLAKDTHHQLWDNYLRNDPDLASRVRGLASQRHFLETPDTELNFNLAYACAISWLLYLQRGLQLTDATDVRTLAAHWDTYWLPAPTQAQTRQRRQQQFIEGFPLADDIPLTQDLPLAKDLPLSPSDTLAA